MDIEEQALVQQIADLHHPDDGDPMDAAIEATDSFTHAMSRSIAKHLAPAIFRLAGEKSIKIDDGSAICTLPSGADVFIIHVSAPRSFDGQTISCWLTTSIKDEKPEQVMSMEVDTTQTGARVSGWSAIENWSSVLDLSRSLAPYAVNSLSGGRSGTIHDRAIEADGGLPGNVVCAALNVVMGRMTIVATSEARRVAEGLIRQMKPSDILQLGDGWSVFRAEASHEELVFEHTREPAFSIDVEQTDLITIKTADHWIAVNDDKGTVEYSSPPTMRLLFSVSNAVGRADGHLTPSMNSEPLTPGVSLR